MELGNWSIKNQLGSTNSKGLPVLFQGSHQGCLLNNHYVYPRRHAAAVDCRVGVHEGASSEIYQSIFLRRTRGLLFGLNLPSSIQSTNTTALHSSPIADLQTLPIPNSSCNPQASKQSANHAPTSTLNRLSHPRGRPVVSLGTIHSRLAALRACTGHVCEGSKWSRKTHLAARMRWRSKKSKWEGPIRMGGQTRAVGIPQGPRCEANNNNTNSNNSSPGLIAEANSRRRHLH